MTDFNAQPWQPILSHSPNFLSPHLEILRFCDAPLYQILREHQSRLETVEIQSALDQPIRVRIDGTQVFDLDITEGNRQGVREKLQSVANRQLPFMVLAGAGFGSELNLIQEIIHPLPNTVVLAMERDPLILLIHLSLQDRSQQLLSGLITWSIGELVEECLVETIKQHALFLLFGGQIELVFGSTAQEEEIRKIYVTAFQNAIRQIASYCEEVNRANQRFNNDLNYRPDSPCRVWSSGSPTEYTTTPILRALHRGLNAVGLQSTFTSLPRGRTRKLVEYQGLVSCNPDTILVQNDPSRGYVPKGEYYRAVWVTDDPSFRKNLQIAPRYDPNELVMYADSTYMQALSEQGAQRLLHLPVFALLEDEGRYKDELAYPLVFVGMVWNLEPFLTALSTNDRNFLEEAYDEVLQSKTGTVGLRSYWGQREIPQSLGHAAATLYERCGRTLDSPATMLAYAIYMVDVYRKRSRMAQALLPLGLHIYGNPDWLPLLGDRYKDRYHGITAYEDLADIYRSAKIVIGIHSLQLPRAINIRDCDILMAGGCLLSDPVEEMSEETILPGRDCETAISPEEFVEKTQMLLNDETRRRQLAVCGRSTILDRYLPQHRARGIVDALKKT